MNFCQFGAPLFLLGSPPYKQPCLKSCPCPVTNQSCKLCLQSISSTSSLLSVLTALRQIPVKSPFSCSLLPSFHCLLSTTTWRVLLSKYSSQSAFAHKLGSKFLRGREFKASSWPGPKPPLLSHLFLFFPQQSSLHTSQEDSSLLLNQSPLTAMSPVSWGWNFPVLEFLSTQQLF